MDEQLTSLDDALGEPTEAVEAQAAPVEEVTTEPAETPAVEAEPESSPPEESWTKTAVLDERHKRQELEQQLNEAKQMMAQYEGYLKGLNPQQPAEQAKPDFWTDPEAAIAATTESLKQEFSQEVEQIKRTQRDQMLTASESMVAQNFEDFPEVKAHVEALIKTNPAVIQQQMALNPNHPWLAVYQFGKKDMALQTVGDIDAYKASVRAEVEAELKAEMEASNEKAGKVPTSLVNQSSKGSVKAGDWAGPTSLDSIL